MNHLFAQQYNFSDRMEKLPKWIVDAQQDRAIQEKQQKQARKRELNLAEAFRIHKDPESGIQREPWGIYFKALPDLNNMFDFNDLPKETFEPPVTPKGNLRNKINYLTIELKHACKNKIIVKLKPLIKQAKTVASSELEGLICHAELVL